MRDEEAGEFARGGHAVAEGDGGMFVADDVARRGLGGGAITVEENIFAGEKFGAQGVGLAELLHELVKLAIVVAREEDEFAFAVGDCQKRAKFVEERGHWERAMNDVAEEDNTLGLVISDQGGEAIEGVVFGRDGHELALGAMGPGVTQMKIGDGEEAMFAKINGAAGVEHDAEKEFERLENGRTRG